MKVKVTITRVIDDDREPYWGLEDWFADGFDSTDFIEFAQDEAVDEILDGATWTAKIIGDECLDSSVPDSPLPTIKELQAEITELRQELIAVLDVAIARGALLQYGDEDYREQYWQLTGVHWEDNES